MWRHHNPICSCLDIPLALLAGHTPHLIVEVSVMCAANERWLLIYQQKLPDKQRGWIIYKVAGWEVAFHTLFHAKCRMNSKRAKQFSEAQKPKSINENENGKTGYNEASNCDITQESWYRYCYPLIWCEIKLQFVRSIIINYYTHESNINEANRLKFSSFTVNDHWKSHFSFQKLRSKPSFKDS